MIQYPTNDTNNEGAWTEYYDQVAEIWRQQFNLTNNIVWDQFAENGGFYSYTFSNSTNIYHVISLNTNLWYKNNKYVQDDEDPGHQFAWLETFLDECERLGEKVWIVGHIPPGKFERFYQFCGEYKGCDNNGGYYGFHWYSEKFNKRWLELQNFLTFSIFPQKVYIYR